MATDIAFAVAVLRLLGSRVPVGLQVFLTALAIADDLGAVLVIAVFYTPGLHLAFLLLALGTWAALLGLNRLGLRALPPYLGLGVLLWFFMLRSGVHATLAGVLLAAAIPSGRLASGPGPAQRLEQRLHGLVAFGIVPLFAFANTSLVLDATVFGQLRSPLGLGIVLGLVAGKPLGIGLLTWAAVRLGWATLPAGVSWRQLWGAGVLAGIGFTMSLFITLLALGDHPAEVAVAKLAILLASSLAGAAGYGLLRTAPRTPGEPTGR